MAMYRMLADAVVLLHFAIVLFVVVGLLLIWLGNALRWTWVNTPWFRVLHLLAIAVVVAEAWLGITCPLTTLEFWLRSQAGVETHDGAFIQYWVHRLLFYTAPDWVFTVSYTIFGALVLLTWWRFPPRRSSS